MPTYEYICDACKHEFEAFQPITAAPITKCPECGKKKVRKLISAGAGFIFKGSGFYITDYREDSYKDAAKKETDASKPADAAKASEGGKTADAKPADTKPGDSKPGDLAKPAAKATETAKPADSKAVSKSSAKASTATGGQVKKSGSAKPGKK
jgi:putative FmdB family regulatory protein